MRGGPMAHEMEFRRRKQHMPGSSIFAVLLLVILLLFVFGKGGVSVTAEAFSMNIPYLDFNGPDLPDITINR